MKLFKSDNSLAFSQIYNAVSPVDRMMNNFQFKVVLGVSDTDTQEYFAKLIGNKIIQNHSISRNAKSVTRTYTDTKEYAIEPAELAHLKNELLILYPDGYIRLRKNYYFL